MGVEVQAATMGHVDGLRKAVSYALWKQKGPRNRLATLLLLKMEPWVIMCQRIMVQWWRQAIAGYFDEAFLFRILGLVQRGMGVGCADRYTKQCG